MHCATAPIDDTVLGIVTGSAESRAENQKLNQMAALLSFGWVFGLQLNWVEKNFSTLPEFTFSGR